MKKIIYFLLFIFLLNATSSIAQNRNNQNKKEYIKTITEKAYWEEYVKRTDRLYRNLNGTVSFTDHLIKVYATKSSSGALTFYFYQGGKLIGKKVGRKMFNDHKFKVEGKPKKKRIKNLNLGGRSSLSSTNYNYLRLEKNDRVSHMSEMKYWKNYVVKYRRYTPRNRKTKFSKRKIVKVVRTLPSRKKITLFYKNKRLVGKKTEKNFVNYLK
ncbi:hypothetical protein [uncultured Lacinutrix sp.]|uniref:hypothetical protein n=1 Tax=uncultured Lacinutrix sp. TaxID=574032 RepID=UPI0026118FA2|nr:hypothetical protein [uncultured Lacinutrix sp.]